MRKRWKGWRMSCDVGEVMKAWRMRKRWKGWRMSCGVGEVMESLENQNEL